MSLLAGLRGSTSEKRRKRGGEGETKADQADLGEDAVEEAGERGWKSKGELVRSFMGSDH